MMHMMMDARDGRLHAPVSHYVYRPTMQYSDDLGKNWTQAITVPAFSRPSISGRRAGTPEEAYSGRPVPDTPEQVIKTWNITPGRIAKPGVLYAGTDTGQLFYSANDGDAWQMLADYLSPILSVETAVIEG
jgi:hypothetical protein